MRHPGYVLTDWALFTSLLTVEEKLVLGVTLAVEGRNPSLRQLEQWLPFNKTSIRAAQKRLDSREGFLYQRPPKRLVQPDGHANPIRASSNRLVRVRMEAEPNRRQGKERHAVHISGKLAAALPRARRKANGKTIPLVVLAWAREEIIAGGVTVSDEAIGARLGLSAGQVERARDELRGLRIVTAKRNGYFKVRGLFPGSDERRPDRWKEPVELHVLELEPALRFLGTKKQRQAVIDYASRLAERSVYDVAERVRSEEAQTEPRRAVDGTRLVAALAEQDLAHRAASRAKPPELDPTFSPELDPDSLPQSSLISTSTSCAPTRAEDGKTQEQATSKVGVITGLIRASNESRHSAESATSRRGSERKNRELPAWIPAGGAPAPWRSWTGSNENVIGCCADDQTHARIEELYDYIDRKYGQVEAFGAIRNAILAAGPPEADGRIILRRLIRRWGEPMPEFDPDAFDAMLAKYGAKLDSDAA